MTLILAPTAPSRERILAYGPPGAGKSYLWQKTLAATPEEVIFHVIDTDGCWEPASASEEFAPHAHRVHHYEPTNWSEFGDAVQKIMTSMDKARGDWWVVDMGDKAWSMAQEFYSDRKHGTGEWDLDAIVDGTSGDDEDVMAKWGTINKLYSPFQRALIKVPGNVFVATSDKELKKDSKGNYFRESKRAVRDFGSIGSKPGGQKDLPYDLNTVLYLSKRAGSKRTIEMVKDRNRESRWEETQIPNEDFSMDFLFKIAGWRPVEGEGS